MCVVIQHRHGTTCWKEQHYNITSVCAFQNWQHQMLCTWAKHNFSTFTPLTAFHIFCMSISKVCQTTFFSPCNSWNVSNKTMTRRPGGKNNNKKTLNISIKFKSSAILTRYVTQNKSIVLIQEQKKGKKKKLNFSIKFKSSAILTRCVTQNKCTPIQQY